MLSWLRQKLGLHAPTAPSAEAHVAGRLLASLACRHAAFEEREIDHALIGGCALAAHRVVRATTDVDFLVLAEHEPRLHDYMVSEGFEVLLRTENVSNYLAANGERIDCLYARRAYTREMLAAAQPCKFGQTEVRVVRPEDIIGLKVQASSNDPSRLPLDMSDVARLIEEHRATLDIVRLRKYFSIFGREGGTG